MGRGAELSDTFLDLDEMPLKDADVWRLDH